MALNISKKRKFVADGVFYAEVNEVSLRIQFEFFACDRVE